MAGPSGLATSENKLPCILNTLLESLISNMDLTSWRINSGDSVVLSIRFSPIADISPNNGPSYESVSYRRKSPSNIHRDAIRKDNMGMQKWSSPAISPCYSNHHMYSTPMNLNADAKPFQPLHTSTDNFCNTDSTTMITTMCQTYTMKQIVMFVI